MAAAASAAERDPTHHRNVLVPCDRPLASGASRPRRDHGQLHRPARDTDIEERADERAPRSATVPHQNHDGQTVQRAPRRADSPGPSTATTAAAALDHAEARTAGSTGGNSDVEGLDVARSAARPGDRPVAAPRAVRPPPSLPTTSASAIGRRRHELRQRRPLGHRRPTASRRGPPAIASNSCPGRHECRMCEVDAHPATDDFRVPQVNGPGNATVAETPSAAAVRSMVPTLPGSCTASSARTRHRRGSGRPIPSTGPGSPRSPARPAANPFPRRMRNSSSLTSADLDAAVSAARRALMPRALASSCGLTSAPRDIERRAGAPRPRARPRRRSTGPLTCFSPLEITS